MNFRLLSVTVLMISLSGCNNGPNLEISQSTEEVFFRGLYVNFVKILSKNDAPIVVNKVLINNNYVAVQGYSNSGKLCLEKYTRNGLNYCRIERSLEMGQMIKYADFCKDGIPVCERPKGAIIKVEVQTNQGDVTVTF